MKVLDRSPNSGDSRLGLEAVEGSSAGKVGECERAGKDREAFAADEMEIPVCGGDVGGETGCDWTASGSSPVVVVVIRGEVWVK